VKVHRVNTGYDLHIRFRRNNIRDDLSHMTAAAM
jgi:hypothetical protein